MAAENQTSAMPKFNALRRAVRACKLPAAANRTGVVTRFDLFAAKDVALIVKHVSDIM
jgi:hypothetical protein